MNRSLLTHSHSVLKNVSATVVERACKPGLPESHRRALTPLAVFEAQLKGILHPGERLLDAGCGVGKSSSSCFAKELGCHAIGVDVRPDLYTNSSLNGCARGDLQHLPFADASFDVVHCRVVVEHLASPEAVFREFYRVLKPEGRMAIYTPNLLHYFGMMARLTPHWFHVWFNCRMRGFDRGDIFPTHYRANTARRLYTLLRKVGFSGIEMSMVEGHPEPLEFNSFLHVLGRGYQWLVTRFDFLRRFRMNIIAIACKH
jgi:SAM-dependent methyltransferase